MSIEPAIIEALHAIGIGLLVGFEREHHILVEERERAAADEAGAGASPTASADATPAPPLDVLGVRTFALLALVGWLLAYLGAGLTALLPVGLAVVGVFLIVQFVLGQRTHGIGLTTEVAAIVVILLGVLVRYDRPLAIALALGTTLLLVAKPWMRAAVGKLRRIEITATVQLLILVAIVLPMLPTEPVDRWDLFPPRKIGLFIVLIAGVGYVGYVATRLLGASRGIGVAGLLGGLASSTATTVTMARLARKTPEMVLPGQVATFLSNTVMCVRVFIVATLLSRDLGTTLAPALGAMAVVLLGGAAWRWVVMRRTDGERSAEAARAGALELENPFALIPALKWGVVLCVILVIAAGGRELFGSSGLLAVAGVAGLADVDGVVLAASEEASRGLTGFDVAALAIAIAVFSNTVSKGVMAVVSGGRAFGVPVAVVFGASIALGGVVAVLTMLVR